jgi:hypothetical protein
MRLRPHPQPKSKQQRGEYPYPLGGFHSVFVAVFRLQPLPTLQLMERRRLADILANQPCPV